MSEAKHIKQCKKLVCEIEKNQYFIAAFPAYTRKLIELRDEHKAKGLDDEKASAAAYQSILSNLHDIMRDAEGDVEVHIKSRVESGAINNADQARKTAAGNIFQKFFAYTLAQNVLCGNIDKPVTVTTSVKGLLNKYALIHVGDDVQKPDSDVIVYSENDAQSPILVFSCKTSIRERAGQTYRWKILCELATCRCGHINGNQECPVTKYRLRYEPSKSVKMCFVTTDFYDELTNPQVSGIFHFFDYSYVAKVETTIPSVHPLQTVIDDINSIF